MCRLNLSPYPPYLPDFPISHHFPSHHQSFFHHETAGQATTSRRRRRRATCHFRTLPPVSPTPSTLLPSSLPLQPPQSPTSSPPPQATVSAARRRPDTNDLPLFLLPLPSSPSQQPRHQSTAPAYRLRHVAAAWTPPPPQPAASLPFFLPHTSLCVFCYIMATFCGLVSNTSVMACHGGWRMPPFRIQRHAKFIVRNFTPINPVHHMNTRGLSLRPDFGLHATFRRGGYLSEFDDRSDRSSFWVEKYKYFIRTLKAVLVFLSEQPGQLKYIEWPSFQSTLKTAALTLVLVSVLIVALSSVDAVLAYLLAHFLRRSG